MGAGEGPAYTPLTFAKVAAGTVPGAIGRRVTPPPLTVGEKTPVGAIDFFRHIGGGCTAGVCGMGGSFRRHIRLASCCQTTCEAILHNWALWAGRLGRASRLGEPLGAQAGLAAPGTLAGLAAPGTLAGLAKLHWNAGGVGKSLGRRGWHTPRHAEATNPFCRRPPSSPRARGPRPCAPSPRPPPGTRSPARSRTRTRMPLASMKPRRPAPRRLSPWPR